MRAWSREGKEPCNYSEEWLGLSDGVSGESVVWQAWGDVLDRVSAWAKGYNGP